MSVPPKNWMANNSVMDFNDPNTPHDKILLVEDKKFYVKSEFLSFSSEFFQGLFNPESGFKEANQDEIEIKDVKAEEFKDFIRACYPIAIVVTDKNYASLINLSTRFLAGPVIQRCTQFMTDNFETFDKLKALEIAIKYDMKDMKSKFNFYFKQDTRVKCDACTWLKCTTCKNQYLRFDNVIKTESFVKEKCVEISKLSAEAQAFILRAILGFGNLYC